MLGKVKLVVVGVDEENEEKFSTLEAANNGEGRWWRTTLHLKPQKDGEGRWWRVTLLLKPQVVVKEEVEEFFLFSKFYSRNIKLIRFLIALSRIIIVINKLVIVLIEFLASSYGG